MSINAHSSGELSAHSKYRADIDGLRAIAVLFVVGFHAFPEWFKGGFIGVDIFFVISGFLISTIIYSNLEKNNFSFLEFYGRRIRRIFPALLVVLTACFVIGWFTLTSSEYSQLGSHIAGGAGFISNIMLWRESGYFDSAANTKPLLHLWSLGVEEQYYIIWPLMLWLAWKNKLNLLAVTFFFFATSFLVNIITVRSDATAAFFLPQSRFWELLIGSTLAYLTLHKNDFFKNKDVIEERLGPNLGLMQNILSFSGFFLLAIGFSVISEELSWPGFWAFFPTLGAMLIIAAGPKAWLNRVILSSPLLVWFGLISYPLYLWHWPLLTFLNISKMNVPSYELILAVVILSIFLSWLTYKLIEKPVRMGDKSGKLAFSLLAMMLIVGMGGYSLLQNNGFQGYGNRTVDKSEFENYFENSLPNWQYYEREGYPTKFRLDCDFYDVTGYRNNRPNKKPMPFSQINATCYTPDPTKQKTVLLWGDSHAQQVYYGLKNNLPNDWQILVGASSGCKPDPSVKEDSEIDYCLRSNWFALKTIKGTTPDVVIVAQNGTFTTENINAMSDVLFDLGVERVIINGMSPHWRKKLPILIMNDLWDNTPERTLFGVDDEVMRSNSELKKEFPNRENLIFADLIGLFCNEQGCLTRIGGDKMKGITSPDSNHLTPIAGDYLAKNLLVDLVVNGRNNLK